ncbi:FAD/NAD(P)-binding domain-containing protein [Thozetella sp. PMI_491]|nr:FAD/NAD(P)-binding domain-containing protein [Thozetella sp. PMI_491]
MPGNRVCVLGAGPVGLVATKNLAEQGLEVTTYEKQDCIGGIWHPNKTQLGVLPVTTKNTSKHCSSFTDFPYPKEAATHPKAKEVEDYLNAYAKQFGILKNIQVSTEIVKVERDEQKGEWIVSTRSTKAGGDGPVESKAFDRVVVASGMLNLPRMPNIKGSEKFTGDLMHSRDFKDPSKYEGKRVIVVGVGATGIDTQSFLMKANTKKIYLSHRKQMLLLPRMVNGKAFDHGMSRRAGMILRTLLGLFPNFMLKMMLTPLVGARKKAFPSLNNHPSFSAPREADGIPFRIPMFSDELIHNLESGIVETVQGIAEITGPRSVTLTDGTVLEDIDAIIVCSGYGYDYVVTGAGNPCDPAHAPDGYAAYKATRFYDERVPFPRLYKGFLSEQYPDSLAFLGPLLITKPPFVMYDLVTMALGSIWSGAYPVPSAPEMRKDIDEQYDFVVRMLNQGAMVYPGFRAQKAGETYTWLNKVAGTGVIERVGNWGREAWKFWWADRKFYGLVLDGPDTPHIYRLFDTGFGRKPWAGAREQIIATNEDVRQLGEKWKQENCGKRKA